MKPASSCRIGITMGDPFGIGPEIIAKALPRLAGRFDITLYASRVVMERAWALTGKHWEGHFVEIDSSADFPTDDQTAAEQSIAAIRQATAAAMKGEISAIVTAPINKYRWATAGLSHRGHTDFLAELAGVQAAHMLFVSRHYRIALATVHLPLRDVVAALTAETIAKAIMTTDRFLHVHAETYSRTMDVLAINPHAGDRGTIGDEDDRVTAAAIAKVNAIGIQARGPFPADAYFGHNHSNPADAVIAMYHDQGLIPAKMIDPMGAVNVTMGLPFIRTSVDHGTAEDIAWRGCANETHFLAAIDMADRIFHKKL